MTQPSAMLTRTRAATTTIAALSGFVLLLVAAPVASIGPGVAASRAVGYSGSLGVAVFAVTLAAALAGWAALLRWVANRRGAAATRIPARTMDT